MRSPYGQIQNNPTTQIIPSSEKLLAMIASAEAKFAVSRENALRDRAYEAMAINARRVREAREHDVRRCVYAGDR